MFRHAGTCSCLGIWMLSMNDEMVKSVLRKANYMNDSHSEHLNGVRRAIERLSKHLEGVGDCSTEDISIDVEFLSCCTLLSPVPVPLEEGFPLLRARKFENSCKEYKYSNVSELSYKTDSIGKGRLNRETEALFYSSYANVHQSISAVLSEIDAKKGDVVNLLRCKTKFVDEPKNGLRTLEILPIGLGDYFRRGLPLPFSLHSSIRESYDLFGKNAHPESLLAMQLTDAFFTDVLKRKESPRLYSITSAIGFELLNRSGPDVDGLLYPSVTFEGHPNIAIKPLVVDEKIRFEAVDSVQVDECYGYGMYELKLLAKGLVRGKELKWEC